ncbi:hypothetical protein TanjilG_08243 [Lupinus angustifolius]|uniref:Lipid-binding serum glycoprotein C-terminal domain-containing protein n=1 Tax=Lupinus angustifolius TaxID=3871 RepID=A0A394DAX7_LUPAN|nr:PREDICTED: uncharacterized protein LOC109338045 [Lupinus angustifolius]OIW20283.1 hypothetical protein TanjilG_08243 [Lupinus angustifolius]
MISSYFPLSFFIFLLQITAFLSSPIPNPSSNLTHILQDVLKAITAKQKWDLKDVRVLKLDIGKVRFGTFRSYEFRIGSGKNNLTLKFSDKVSSWNKFAIPKSDLGFLIHQISYLAVLDGIKLDGPFELRVDGIHNLSLSLPMNVSYTGLKRIIVGEGITVEVRGAQEISLYHSAGLDLQMNGSTMFRKRKSDLFPFLQSTCMPLIPIRILGSASLVAYRARNPSTYIGTTLISEDTVELLPEKCYDDHTYRKRACPIDSLSLRLSMVKEILKSLLVRKILEDQFFGFLKAVIKASVSVKFPLELEIDVGSNITLGRTLPDWRTRPSVGRVWFEILARVEENRLKPVSIKKLKPFIESDSVSWASLLSNMSYTKMRPVLLPPEALTLDVKW